MPTNPVIRPQEELQYTETLGPALFQKISRSYYRKAPAGMSYQDWTSHLFKRNRRGGIVMTTVGSLVAGVGGLGIGALIAGTVRARSDSDSRDDAVEEEQDEHAYGPDFSPAIEGVATGVYIFAWAAIILCLAAGVALVALGIHKTKKANGILNKLNATETNQTVRLRFGGASIFVAF